ncbi:MAG: magnesium transporter [Gemmatimonadetes bacterium]|nr:magnesium transporter [Gemmatimonadota bacterium]
MVRSGVGVPVGVERRAACALQTIRVVRSGVSTAPGGEALRESFRHARACWAPRGPVSFGTLRYGTRARVHLRHPGRHPVSPDQREKERSVAALVAPDILDLLETEPGSIAAETEELHPADLADVAELIPRELVSLLLTSLPRERAASVLEYVDDDLRAEILEAMDPDVAAGLLSGMTPDERADALDEMDEEAADEILEELPERERAETERLLQYEPDTAGGLMTTEFVSVPGSQTVEEALVAVRAIARAGRREAMGTVYVVDGRGVLSGVLSLRELLAAPEGARISDIAWSEVVTVQATADREEVAQLTSNYDLVAVPVVDADSRLLGVITVDDVIDVIQEEQTEDVQKFGGLEALEDPYLQSSIGDLLKKRSPWLLVLFVGQMFTAAAMGYFQSEIDAATVLALFVPLVISSGGNSGSQATSLIIRALALQELTARDWFRVMGRELFIGLILGLMLGLVGLLRVVAWQWMGISQFGEHYVLLATTVGATVVGVVLFGTLTGAMLPFFLKRLGFDPASASAPLVATLVDVTGVVLYFTIALLLLRGTLL